ncbi:PfkB family carbohydrate kinase [Haliangium ochraceum]|uniref:PfkB domain protein n=1 Tax=Haliangium ochraceum (strain DSM 14365 / JCM 11303 / SMP-2) TaxID=502025 RepID=D0LL07_HALO1|nr:PfkB family carbohydrate kinase [Haliangium ochraceum]ACY16727.1 PfkB domain protein [Haliangium ochraceum DSM 14365]
MTETTHRIIGLGELLWDMFPDRQNLGGAPANVAYHASALGDRGVLLSRVGRDALGESALAQLGERGVDLSAVQRDDEHRTGVVHVQVGPGGSVRFEIDPEVAWAYPVWSEDWGRCIDTASALCFGSLLCAFEAGRTVVREATARARPEALRLLDLNLRPPFASEQAIDTALECANAIKLSEEEAEHLAQRFGVRGVDSAAEHLLATRGMRAVAVTFGARGSAIYTAAGREQHSGVPLAAGVDADPVGAGDAFTAALAHHLVRAHAPARAIAAANRYGSFVAASPGAMPPVPEDIRAAVTAPA